MEVDSLHAVVANQDTVCRADEQRSIVRISNDIPLNQHVPVDASRCESKSAKLGENIYYAGFPGHAVVTPFKNIVAKYHVPRGDRCEPCFVAGYVNGGAG